MPLLNMLKLIEQCKIETTPPIAHTYNLQYIDKVYDLFENKRYNVIKVAVKQ